MPTILEKPVILDETGQDIVTKLDEIKEAIGGSGEYTPIRISVTTPPYTTNYIEGETLDLSGIVVKATFSNGLLYDITDQCTFSPDNGDTLSLSDTSVSISYTWTPTSTTFTTTQSISVINPVYGVEWDGSSSSTMTRTDGAITFVDPVPYYSGMSETPSSPFDSIMPWAGMEIEERTGGTMVKIPKFWYLISQNENGIKIQISSIEKDGFRVSPAHMDRGDGKGERDYVYIGRYHCNGTDYKSKTGYTPKNSITRSDARVYIQSIGTNIWQVDFAMRFTIWLLYIVEYADWNSQEKIGYGCGDNSGIETMGYTDSMPYHTGTTKSNRTTYGVGTQYRYIEGLWDNVMDWIDGSRYASGLWIILNPNNMSDIAGGVSVGTPSNGYPSQLTLKDITNTFMMFIPTQSNGSTTTYMCDSWDYNGASPCLIGGGSYMQQQSLGLFRITYASASDILTNTGCRLQELPNNS